jgi:hypothetical protein
MEKGVMIGILSLLMRSCQVEMFHKCNSMPGRDLSVKETINVVMLYRRGRMMKSVTMVRM